MATKTTTSVSLLTQEQLLTNLDLASVNRDELSQVPQRSARWFEIREGNLCRGRSSVPARITASNYGSATYNARFASPNTVLKTMLWGRGSFRGNKFTEHGTLHEPVARQAYEAYLVRAYQGKCVEYPCHVEERGFTIDPMFSWMGASPDGIIHVGRKDGPGLLEIKCPYKGDFYPEIHPEHYAQIQGNMATLGLSWAHYVQWSTTKGILVQEYPFDETYWTAMFEKLRRFYMEQYLPRAILAANGKLTPGEINLNPLMVIKLSEKERAERKQQATEKSSCAPEVTAFQARSTMDIHDGIAKGYGRESFSFF